jgi:hypothetical protein
MNNPLLAEFGELAGEPETLVVSAAEDPEMANMIASQALSSEQPVMADAPSGQVELPGGWIDPQGNLHRLAVVNELTGLAEEKLARIDPVANLPLLLNTFVECALDNIGGHKPTPEMLKGLLVGDREALLLGIRIATYGETLEMHISCPACQAEEDLAIELREDVPVKTMDTPEIRKYDVELRGGRIAVVQPATVGIQDEVWDVKKTAAEMKTATLERCILSIDGRPVGHQEAQALGLGDRKTLLDFLEEIQPGPDYEGVRLPCQACGREFVVRLDLTDLFR